ncbi:MAG TPA: phytanoyl-CoA dioxygenase family protein [Tepidisphaeraceae bacterium]|jgi:ectoine hydroxylase-related dioxygenase (phytanoyl-CoA dioxygenase family)
MPLTQQQLDFFNDNGYLRIGRILEAAEIELLRREYDHEFAKANDDGSFRNLSENDTADLEKKRGGKLKMLQIMQMCERNIHFRKLIYDARILDLVQDLIGPNIMLFHDQALFKPARTGGAVFWHQDNAYWKCRPASLVSCWLTLDDATRENGAMQVIPGSHRKPMWHPVSEQTNALLDLKDQVDVSKAVVVDLPAGSIMFHHCQTLHYTQPNATDIQRRAFAVHFMTPGTRFESGEAQKVGFAKPMLRMSI